VPQFKRIIEQSLLDELDNDKITLLFGPRQVGKSYLLNQIFQKKKSKSEYFDLEQPDIMMDFAVSDSEIQKKILNSGEIVFIDEFHYLKNVGKIFKSIYDLGKRDKSKQIKIFASGSSALEMHNHIKESMAGRIRRFQVRPLTLSEYLTSNSADLTIEEYFIYGGLPEVYEYSGVERNEYLKNLYQTYIQRDIKSFIREENMAAFNKLLFLLADYQGQVVATNNLASEILVSSHTVQNYIDILEQTFTLYTLNSFSKNLSNELKKSKKYYLYDLGIRNTILKNFSRLKARKDIGVIIETYVLHYLQSIKNEADTDLFFWRTSNGSEVDFIWNKNQSPTPIEVKTNYNKKQITKSLEAFIRAYPKTEDIIIIFYTSKNLDDYEEFYYKDYRCHLININNLDYLEQVLSK
jgi:uncharacterized protein